MAHPLVFRAAIATLTAISVISCQSPPDEISEFEQPIQTGEQLRLGALMPETGRLATVGQPLLNALVLVRDRANACGGVNQAPVALVTADTRSNSPSEADALVRLVRGTQVHGAIATLSADSTQRLIGIATRNRVPLLSPTNADIPLENGEEAEATEAETFDGYWARTVLAHQQEAIALAEMAIAKGFDAIATVVSDTPDGLQFEQAFTQRFEQLGGTVVNAAAPIRYRSQALSSGVDDNRLPFGFGGEPPSDESPDGTAPEASAPDVNEAADSNELEDDFNELLGASEPPPAAVVVFLENQAGIDWLRAIATQRSATDIPWLVAQTPTLAGLLKDRRFRVGLPSAVSNLPQAGSRHLLTGAMGLSVRPTREAFQVLVQAWQARFDEPMGAYVPQAWDAATLLLLAAEAGQANDGVAIRSQLRAVANPPGVPVVEVCQGLQYLRDGESIDYQGASGSLNLDSWGNVMGAVEFDLWQITATGDKEIIDQIKLGQMEPVTAQPTAEETSGAGDN
ncbi:MAG: ABC transporter substrate-binding protein [Synechococcales bacterium]|nr:ABC transporter substrate-binding protein [Synechococcales bacterium]